MILPCRSLNVIGLLLLLLTWPDQSNATALTSETEVGSSLSSEAVSGSGGLFRKPGHARWDWNLGVTVTKITTSAPDASEPIIDKTTELVGGVGFTSPTHVLCDIAGTYASTPAENVIDSGPSISLGYEFFFGGKSHSSSIEEGAPFVPSLQIKANWARLTYVQSFTTTVTRRRKSTTISRPISGSHTIVQTGTGGTLTANPWQWLSAHATYTNYAYDKDVNEFLSTLDSSTGLGSRFNAGLAATVSGLPENSTEVGLAFFPDDLWVLDFSESVTLSITDKTKTWASKLKAVRDISPRWEVGLGDEYDTSDASNANLVIAVVGVSF